MLVNTSHRQHSIRRSESGAMIVEMSMVALLLISIILAIIDLGRFFFIQNTLHKAAVDALTIAEKIEHLSIETRALNPAVTSDNNKLDLYKAAVQRVIDEANITLNASLLTNSATESSARLFSTTTRDALATGSLSIDSDVAVMRPGASMSYRNADDNTVYYDHPTYCSSTSPSCPAIHILSPSASWEDTLKGEPIVIEIRAQVRTLIGSILPNLRSTTLIGRAIGYREVTPKGAYAQAYELPTPNTSTVYTTSISTTSVPTSIITTSSVSSASTSTTMTTAVSVSSVSSTTEVTSSILSSAPSTTSTTSTTATTGISVSSTVSTSTSRSTTTTSINCFLLYWDCFIHGGTFNGNPYGDTACTCTYSG